MLNRGINMSHTVSLIGRLRIEHLVWDLDRRLWELPYRRRVGCRREVRQNILAAARESGVAEALRGMGSADEVALDYLTAEYGDSRRPHWWAAGWTSLLVVFGFLGILDRVNISNEAAIRAVDPQVSGTFTVPGIAFLQHATVYTFSNGHAGFTGGDFSPLFYAVWIAAVILAGRLWRARFRRHHATSSQGSPA
jgi:hypothetical protein